MEGRGEDEEKKWKRERGRRNTGVHCLLVCFYYHITHQTIEVHESEVTCLACVKVRKKTAPSAIKTCSSLPVCYTSSKNRGAPKQVHCHCKNQRGGSNTSHYQHVPLFRAYVGIPSTWYTTRNDSRLILFGLALSLQATLPLTCGFTNILTKKWVYQLEIIKQS